MVKPARTAAVFLRAVDVRPTEGKRVATGIDAWDRVLGDALGGGPWLPSTLLLAGPPGHGKSTRALILADALSRVTSRPSVFLSAEMLAPAVRRMADRLGLDVDALYLNEKPELEVHLACVRAHEPAPACLVFDSLPMLLVDGERSSRWSQAAALKMIVDTTRQVGAFSIVIQHVTKDHEIAGAEALQHEVDVVAFVEEDQIFTSKNRHGPSPRKATLPSL